MLEKDARNFLERTPYQYINIRRDCSGKGVNGEGGSDETVVLRPTPAFTVFTSSIVDQGGRSLGSHHGAAEVPSTYSSSCPAFVSAAPIGSRSGVGTIVQRNEDFVNYTAGTSLSERRLLLAFAFTRLDFDKE